MDFWRSGRARSHREESIVARGQKRSIMYRLRHLYFPPWVPVAFIIVVVFGILGLLFVTRSATGAPRIGQDHWHASYTYYMCGEKQPNAPTWESGVHTHGDGIMHIHPFQPFEEGSGARMVKWFDYGGGVLSQDEIRLPGQSESKTMHNGDTCPDGTPEAGQTGTVQVFVNGKKLDDWSRYIPHDGDRIQLIFGPEQSIVQLDDRQVLDESAATRTIEMTITGAEASTQVSPSAPTMKAGETVKFLVHNKGSLSHGIRIAGPDGKYNTADDFVAVPVGSDPKTVSGGDYIEPGKDGFVIVRFDNSGQIKFEDPTSSDPATTESYVTGTIVVEGGASGTATPAPEEFDQSVDVAMQDSVYNPKTITLEAGKKFGIKLTNNGSFVHNLRIDGADHKFETEDDIISPDIDPTGGTGTALGTLDAGTYSFRDDFNQTLMTGTLTIQ
jgi:plastocyanin